MIRWLIRSVSRERVRRAHWSLGLTVLLAACQSAPHAAAPPVPHDAPEAHDAPESGAAALPRSDTAAVPPLAAQGYADALKAARAGHTDDAQLKFKELCVAYPEFAGPAVNLGLLYAQSGRLPDAEAAFKMALERNPQDAVAGNELGIVERKLGHFAEAEAAYQRTITAQPAYAPAYLNLGILYDLYLAEPKKALEQFEHYVQIAGDNKQVAGWLVELRKRVGAGTAPAKKEAS